MTEAIILKRRDYREHDTSITVYTKRFGKLELVARGTKKIVSKLSSHLQPGYHIILMGARGRQHDKLAGSVVTDVFPHIRASLTTMAGAAYILDITDRLITNTLTDSVTFELLRDSLNALNVPDRNNPSYAMTCAHLFAIKLLDAIGYRPEVYRCIECYRGMVVPVHRFHVFSGGIICDRCRSISFLEPYFDISDEGVRLMRIMLERPVDVLASTFAPGLALDEMNSLMHNIVRAHVGRELPSYHFFERIHAH